LKSLTIKKKINNKITYKIFILIIYLISSKKRRIIIIRKFAIFKKNYKNYIKYIKELDYKETKYKKSANKI